MSGISLGLKDSSGSVEDADEILEEWLVRLSVPSGALSWLLEHVSYAVLASALGFLGACQQEYSQEEVQRDKLRDPN